MRDERVAYHRAAHDTVLLTSLKSRMVKWRSKDQASEGTFPERWPTLTVGGQTTQSDSEK